MHTELIECAFQVGICLGLYTQNETEIECEKGNKNSCVFSQSRVVLAPFQINAMFSRNRPIQECIPAGCVPPAVYLTGVFVPGVSAQGRVSVWGSVSGYSLSGGCLSRGLRLCLGGLCPGILCPGVFFNETLPRQRRPCEQNNRHTKTLPFQKILSQMVKMRTSKPGAHFVIDACRFCFRLGSTDHSLKTPEGTSHN